MGDFGFYFNDDDDAPIVTTKKSGRVHRALYGGGVMCESSINDEHRTGLRTTFDDAAVTCKVCLRRIGGGR